jgi:hypothetical protein
MVQILIGQCFNNILPCLDDQLLMHIGNYRRIYTILASCSMTRITYICHFRPAVTLIPHTNIQKYGVLHKIRVCLHLYNMVQFIISQCFNNILTLVFLRWSLLINIWNYRIIYTILPSNSVSRISSICHLRPVLHFILKDHWLTYIQNVCIRPSNHSIQGCSWFNDMFYLKLP